MKKRIIKIWGVGLALVLVFSLIFSAAPVSAGTLSWGDEDLPDEFVDVDGDDIVDMEVSGDGSTIYVTANYSSATGFGRVYRSTNVGESWTTVTINDDGLSIRAEHVSVAPDDPNYIAVASDNGTVFISSDAGANWNSLGQVTAGFDNVLDLELSVEKGGNHFVAVAGIDGGAGEVWSYEIGAIGAAWSELSAKSGYEATQEIAAAVAFSPNFYSDQVLVAVTADYGVSLNLQVYSYNQGNWNSGAFSDFPADLMQDTPAVGSFTSLDAAAIAMAPDYLGSDEDMRVLFVGLAVQGTTDYETDGVFRVEDTDVTVLKDEKAIGSVAFDGSLLVAGRYDGIDIYRSTDALDDSPSTSGSTGSREPGGANRVLVGLAGDTVVAGTSGDESAFAVSEDNGKTFSDISLIDTFLTVLSDVAVTPDGSKIYLLSSDNDSGTVDVSLWLYESSWKRIWNSLNAGATDYIIRLAPDDPEVMYIADAGGTNLYFSSTGGMDKWHTRVYKESTGVVDMAVEGDGDTVYILTTVGYVSKSTNRGFTWGSKVSSKLSGGSSMIMSMGEDKLLAGSTDGRVAYSTDGNTSWTKISDTGFGDTGAVQTTATGLADGDFIIAGSADGVYAWELGEDDEWDDISPDAITSNMTINGIGIWEGVLYVIADDTANSVLARTLTPTADDPTWSSAASAGETFDQTPTALRMSSDGDITKLWAIDRVGTDELFSYKDPLATVGVELSAPADKKTIPFNIVSGESMQIIFTWKAPSDKVTKFNFEIATDSGFNEDVLSASPTKSSGTYNAGDTISFIVGPGGSGSDIKFMPETTYYWRVRVDAAGPVRSAWSETRNFTTGALPEVQPPVIIEQPPAPIIEVPEFPPITIQPPEIVLPAPTPAPEIVIPPAPEPTPPVPSWAIYAIIIIGAVLVIALIVLIMRTRRPV